MQTVSQSPTDPAFFADPYPFYNRMRALGDLVFWKDYGIQVATTASLVNAILRHPKLGREVPSHLRACPSANLQSFYDVEAHSLLELEPPAHTRLRKLVLGAFTRNRVLSMATDISRTADALIDKFPDGPFDLLDSFARPLPVSIIARLLGVPVEMGPQLLAWSNAMVAMYQARRDAGVEAAASTASTEFSLYVHDLIDQRLRNSGDDLIGQLIVARVDGERLSRDEIVSTVILLLNAGHEATVHTIGNAVWHLCGFEERHLSLMPEQIEGTVEECLRFDPPLHMFRRYVYEKVTIQGHALNAGDEIGCLLGSACRDDAVWPDGEVFDPFRLKRPNVAFGAGIHFCVGAPLARLELQIALPALFSRCPALRIAEPPKVANVFHFRGLERLLVAA